MDLFRQVYSGISHYASFLPGCQLASKWPGGSSLPPPKMFYEILYLGIMAKLATSPKENVGKLPSSLCKKGKFRVPSFLASGPTFI